MPTQFRQIREGRLDPTKYPQHAGGYSIKHTGKDVEELDHDAMDSEEHHNHYEVHHGGKKVGHLTHSSYFGDIHGELHGKKVRYPMHRKHPLLQQIRHHAWGVAESLELLPHDNQAASGPDVIKRTKTLARNVQRPTMKNKIQALAGKQYEPNRTKTRHPATPRQRVTGPNETGSVTGGGLGEGVQNERDDFDPKKENERFNEELKRMVYDEAVREMNKKTFKDIREARESEFSANRHLSQTSSVKRKPGHYLMRHGVPVHNEPHTTSQQALSAYHNLADKSNVKIRHVKEETSGYVRGDIVHWNEHPSTGHSGITSGYVVGTISNTGYRVKRHDNNKVVPVGHQQIIHHHRQVREEIIIEQLNVGDKVCVNCKDHPYDGQAGDLYHKSALGHHVRFTDGHEEPFQEPQLQKIMSRGSAIGAIASTGMSEETVVEGKYTGYNEHSAAHRAARSLVKNWHKSSRSAVFHSDGSSVIHHHSFATGRTSHHDHGVSSATNVDHSLRELGGWHNNSHKELENHRQNLPNNVHAHVALIGSHHVMSLTNGHQKGSTMHPMSEMVAMAAGAAGDPGHVQNATDNYASQLNRFSKKKLRAMMRRKKPITMGAKDDSNPGYR